MPDLALVQPDDLLRVAPHEGQVVGDEQDGELQGLAEFVDQNVKVGAKFSTWALSPVSGVLMVTLGFATSSKVA